MKYLCKKCGKSKFSISLLSTGYPEQNLFSLDELVKLDRITQNEKADALRRYYNPFGVLYRRFCLSCGNEIILVSIVEDYS